ncbi:prepilin peptidase [Hyphomicrobium sp.]|uniref:prepilin peptidase n=1 Tax=Hyphomicrobium sp. TaxID=82 RepID=UPI003F70F98F
MVVTSALDPSAIALSVALAAILIVVVLVDVREMRIPDACNAAILALGLLACAVLHHQTVAWGALSAGAGFLAMDTIRVVYWKVRNVEGLGRGDIKFVAAGASWIGLEALPHMILVAAVIALFWQFAAAARGRSISMTTAVPFGPFLACALWAVWLTKA